MDIQNGHYRLSLKSGMVTFGEVLEVSEEYIRFLTFTPTAIEKRIPISNIVDAEKYNENDIPAYE